MLKCNGCGLDTSLRPAVCGHSVVSEADTRPAISTRLKQVPLCANNAHLLRVDLAVDDDPGSSPQLSAGRQVHNDRLTIGPQVLHNQGPGLQQIRATSTQTFFNTGYFSHCLSAAEHSLECKRPSQNPEVVRPLLAKGGRAGRGANLEHALKQVPLAA